MPVLHLGVIDQPYGDGDVATTGEVAQYLENKYHVMEIFFEQHKRDIAGDLENSVKASMESLLMGAPATPTPYAEAAGKIEHGFKQFLSLKEMDGLGYPGVPTKAAMMGVNHRMKIRHGSPRPSFIDTGLYESSFKCWVD
jgi:hypothetical protein